MLPQAAVTSFNTEGADLLVAPRVYTIPRGGSFVNMKFCSHSVRCLTPGFLCPIWAQPEASGERIRRETPGETVCFPCETENSELAIYETPVHAVG